MNDDGMLLLQLAAGARIRDASFNDGAHVADALHADCGRGEIQFAAARSIAGNALESAPPDAKLSASTVCLEQRHQALTARLRTASYCPVLRRNA